MAGLEIRKATKADLAGLLELYVHFGMQDAPCPPALAPAIFDDFERYTGSAIFVGFVDGVMVCSCALVVVPNLTRLGTPYALIENVVTHGDYRTRGFGTAILDVACEQAWEHQCYKVMLMTGSREPKTLSFYESAGFAQSKVGFQKRRKIAK